MKCLIVDDDDFAREVIRVFVERTQGLEILAECNNAISALQILQSNEVDILLLDVEMPEMTGLDLVKSLSVLPQVILITSKEDYAVDAFEYSLTDYLVKPITYARFLKAIQKAQKEIENFQPVMSQRDKESIFVKADNKLNRINLFDIYFIEALSDYVIINTEKKRYIVHATMKSLEEKLPTRIFARVHRSFIVNLTKVETIEDLSVVMPQKTIPIGNSYKTSFLSKLNFL